MAVSGTRQGMTARLETPFIDITAIALEFFLYITTWSDPIVLTASVVAEDRTETVVLTVNSETRPGWKSYFWNSEGIQFSGLHKFVIEGWRSLSGPSGMFIDDIVIQSAILFGNVLIYACTLLELSNQSVRDSESYHSFLKGKN